MTGAHVQGTSWPELTDEQRQRVADNLGLVGWVLRRRGTPTDEWDDSFTDGVIGLCRAAQLFEPERGFAFSTYAMNWIREGVTRGRELSLGANYRRAKERGDEWHAPLSLDAEQSLFGDGLYGDLADVLEDEGPSVDRQAEAAAMVDEMRQVLGRWRLDRIDRAIADDLLTHCDESWRQRDARIGARFGRQSEIIRQRRMRLQRRLRDWAGDTVAA